MSDTPGRREFTRVDVKFEAVLQSGDTARIQCCLSDVSLNGVYLECTKELPLNSDCRLTLLLGEGSEDICIHATGTVVRVDDAGVAVQFTNILGEESLGHLRNLVLFNSQALAPLVEQEIREHVGLKPKV